MPLRGQFYPLLAEPSPLSWRKIVGMLDEVGVTDAQHAVDAAALRSELRAWPPEVERPAPRNWLLDQAHHDADLKLCRSVREVDLYARYVEVASSSHLLRLRDGTPAVRLQRSFTGTLQGVGGRQHSLGVPGQADLCGSLCVEWEYSDEEHDRALLGYSKGWCGPPGDKPLHRLGVYLEVEVKRDGGAQRPEQVAREAALHRRGELYFVVTRTSQLIKFLVEARTSILKEICAQ